MRERVYPRWTAAGKMTQAKADQEIAAMRAIVETLEGLRAKQRPELFVTDPEAKPGQELRAAFARLGIDETTRRGPRKRSP